MTRWSRPVGEVFVAKRPIWLDTERHAVIINHYLLGGVMRILFALLGALSLLLGLIGAFLPVLPTTPFILLAALLFSKSSPRVHHWMLNHPWFGTMIRDWQTYRGLRPKIRRRAIVMMIISFAFSIYMVPLWPVRLGLLITFIMLLAWFLRLPLVTDVANGQQK